MNAQLTTIEAVKNFVFAGSATVTLRSKKTGERFTYKIKASDDGECHFVKYLRGPANERDYAYLGYIRKNKRYAHGGLKAHAGPNTPVAVAFEFFGECLWQGKLSRHLEVFHEGKCGRCGRKLTVPGSIKTGLGPDCAEIMGVPMCDDPTEAASPPWAPKADPMNDEEFYKANVRDLGTLDAHTLRRYGFDSAEATKDSPAIFA